MKKFVITFAMTGGVTLEAETEKQAREMFDKIPEHELYEDVTPAEITDIYEEVEDEKIKIKKLTNQGYEVGQKINIFIDNYDQIAVIDEIFDDFMLVAIHKSHSTDSFAIGWCKYCHGSGFVVIHGREDTQEDCPECNGWMFTRLK